MASGGGPPYSKSATEPRSRRAWQRTASASDKEDNVSINSLPNELRPNNWDFSDWKPSSTTYDSAKRRKKGNPEREREQSLSQDSPPPSERHQRTPSTFPRTRITPLTPTSQRVALEKLRQQLTFSDQDDVSNDGERNNEKNMARRGGHPVNYQRQDMSDDLRRVVDDARQDRVGTSTNSLPPEMRDRDQIVGRLMQIREYIKQANSMMTALQKSGNPQAHQEDFGKLRKLADNLQEQERSYLGLLQQLLSLKEDTAAQQEEGSQREVTPTGLFEDTQSLDFDVRSETSEATTELSQNSANPNRPRIEDKLGLDSAEGDEDETEDVLGRGVQIPGLDTMDNTLLPSHDITAANTDWDHYDFRNNEDGKQTLEAKEKELKSLLEQQELLKKLAHQQEQMKALRGRQQALLALQRDAQRKLAEAKARDIQAKSIIKSYSPNSNPPRLTNNDDGQERSDTASDSVPPELQEIRQRLNYLKNELKDKNPRTEERQNNMDAEAAALALDDNRRQLQEKLLDLQEKKQTMDQLLNELQGLRSQRYEELLNNGLEPSVQVPQASTQSTSHVAPAQVRQSTSHVTPTQVRQAEEIADRTETDAKDLIDKLESREKLQKLQEVKARLNQLRSLISYYDTANASGNPPEVDEQTAFRNFLEYGEPRNNRLAREPLQDISSQDLQRSSHTERTIPIEIEETKSDDDNLSKSDSSETESKLSSLGPWGDDPEIQEKVRKLKEAKGKLKQLQDLVTVVQQSPDAARALPDNLADLAASLEDADSVIQGDDKSDGELPMSKSERDSFYEAKMQEQMRELDQLKDERRRLLTIQQQLQSLHDRFTVDKQEAEIEDIEEDKDITITKKKVEDEVEEEEEAESDRRAPVVTFSSNDEVYDKMRKQRIIREELRSKKRELEAIMKKDNKKHYSKNQDNQSDTVSFSTADAFGFINSVSASADATMATWGGSTVDNLESITEDGNPEGNDGEDDDDAYPSDGIIQVEEEEEENDYDNETYTIEDDVRQNVQARSLRRPTSEGGAARTKKRQTYPRAKRETKGGARPKQAWSKYGRKDNRVRQENYRSAEEIIQDDVDGTRQSASSIEALQQQLERTASLCQNLMRDQQSQSGLVQAGYNFRPSMSSMSPDMLQQSLQHQQVLMSLNQCFQQMSMQQMEIQNMQRRMQQEFEQRNSSGSAFGDDLRLRSLSSLPIPGDSRGLSPNVGIFPPRPDTFSMQPQFPNDFHSVRNTPGSLLVSGTPGEDSVFELDRQNSQQNKISQHTAGVRKKSGSASQFLRTDSQTQMGKKISPGSSSRNLSQRSQQPKQEDIVPPLNIQDILRKKRKQNIPRNWSNVSLASSSQVTSGLDTTGIASTLQQRLQGSSSQYRPGLSAGISGAGFLDGESVTSNQSSRPADNEDIRGTRDNGDADLSLFEALREKIYSEVATLISQNENRPHFLIELFCELQLFTTDYLRQRVLYCIKDVISKYLTDGNGAGNTASAVATPSWMNPNITASELTPSESAITSEDEELKYKVKAQSRAAAKKKLLARAGSLQDDQFDYMENADNDSSLSTPSNSYWENPFSQDALGDTVINLDKALRKMREQEERFRAGETAAKLFRDKDQQENDLPSRPISEPTSSSAVDQGSECSASSSINNPKIDTQKVDQQIKEIMTEVIPVIKEHMDNVCSSQLITYIKRLVLSLTRQRDATQYTRFFRSQMGSALQDTLDKFEGKKMRECGEDLLVDMSEVLFNELAFFRLMEDYGDPLPTDKLCTSATQTQEDLEDYEGDGDVDQTDESDTTESTVSNEEGDETNSSMKLIRNEEEELGKARDDEFASEVQIQDDDKDEDTESPYNNKNAVQIELAVSETKPFTRIGSDEDDEDADESLSADDQPSETAVSRDVMMEKSSALDQDDGTTDTDTPIPDNTEGDADQGANSTSSSPTKDKNIIVNGINGEIVENGEITVDDLPASLSIQAQDDLQKKIAEEEISNDSVNAIINNNNNVQDELVGDGEFLKEPDDIVSG